MQPPRQPCLRDSLCTRWKMCRQRIFERRQTTVASTTVVGADHQATLRCSPCRTRKGNASHENNRHTISHAINKHHHACISLVNPSIKSSTYRAAWKPEQRANDLINSSPYACLNLCGEEEGDETGKDNGQAGAAGNLGSGSLELGNGLGGVGDRKGSRLGNDG